MKFDEDLATIHGYLCGDGYVIRNSNNQKHKFYIIGFRNTNLFLLKDFQRKFENLFKIKPHISKDNDRCKISNKEIYFFLTKNFSYYSYEWKMPELSKKISIPWLRAFFDCEALDENQPRKSRLIGLECCNLSGLFQVKTALERLGILSNIRKKSNRTIWRLNICGLENLKKFKKDINFLHQDKQLKLNESINSYINYKWEVPTTKFGLIGFVKQKGRFRGKRGLFFYSIIRNNLIKVKNSLNKYKIKSKIKGPWFNQYGSKNYCLRIKEVKWLEKHLRK